jgi:hypothetical protein
VVLVNLKASFCPARDMCETWSYMQVSALLRARAALHIKAMTKIVFTFMF